MSETDIQPSPLHPASCAWWITCSPHEWTWTQKEQEAMARAVVEMSGRIHRLTAAIEKHRDTFPDEACEGELELWATISTKQEQDHEA